MHSLKNFMVLPVYYSALINSMPINKWMETRRLYKLFYIKSGTLDLMLNNRPVRLTDGCIFVQPPGEELLCTRNEDAEGYFCFINPVCLYRDFAYLLDMFLFFPFYNQRFIIHLRNHESAIIKTCFEILIREERSGEADSKQVAALHLQMILLKSKRAGKENRSRKGNSGESTGSLQTPFFYS
jgi:AraC family transcriptional activator of pobA